MVQEYGDRKPNSPPTHFCATIGKPEFTFEEFVQIIKNTAGKREPLTEDEAQDALWVYDHEDSGLITLKEFKSILQTTPGEPLSDAELKEVLEKLGITSASSIKYDGIHRSIFFIFFFCGLVEI